MGAPILAPGALSLPVWVGPNLIQLKTPDLGPFEPAGESDGLVMVQIGCDAYEFSTAVRIAQAVIGLAADHPEKLAASMRRCAELRREVAQIACRSGSRVTRIGKSPGG